MSGFDSAKRVINGNYGNVWLDGELVAEFYGLQLKVAATKKDVFMPRQMMSDTKITSLKGTGSIKSYKTNSRMAILLGGALKSGRDVRFTLVSGLDDPDAYGAERVAVTGVSFDDLVLANWERNTEGTTDIPFTFSEYDFLDLIEVR